MAETGDAYPFCGRAVQARRQTHARGPTGHRCKRLRHSADDAASERAVLDVQFTSISTFQLRVIDEGSQRTNCRRCRSVGLAAETTARSSHASCSAVSAVTAVSAPVYSSSSSYTFLYNFYPLQHINHPAEACKPPGATRGLPMAAAAAVVDPGLESAFQTSDVRPWLGSAVTARSRDLPATMREQSREERNAEVRVFLKATYSAHGDTHLPRMEMTLTIHIIACKFSTHTVRSSPSCPSKRGT
jgi:hypothetical protein